MLPEREGFYLINRHDLMTEMRHVFKGEGSVLFPGFIIPETSLKALNEKRCSSGKVDELTQVLSSIDQRYGHRHNFLSFIIDEAHSLRNLTTYGAIGAALLGVISKRTIPISATPFIDSTQDVATLMTFIDPTMKAAHKSWWKEATRTNADDTTVQEVSNLCQHYIIRRERDVLKNQLTRKTISVINVDCHESELEVYKRYEDLFLKAAQSADPDLTVGKKELATVLLSYLINMVRGTFCTLMNTASLSQCIFLFIPTNANDISFTADVPHSSIDPEGTGIHCSILAIEKTHGSKTYRKALRLLFM